MTIYHHVGRIIYISHLKSEINMHLLLLLLIQFYHEFIILQQTRVNGRKVLNFALRSRSLVEKFKAAFHHVK